MKIINIHNKYYVNIFFIHIYIYSSSIVNFMWISGKNVIFQPFISVDNLWISVNKMWITKFLKMWISEKQCG